MSWRRPRAFALRLHVSAAPPRVGLTQALGGRKAFCNCAARMHDTPSSVSATFRKNCRHVASSSKSARRAHTSHALRSPASEAKCALRSVRQRLMRSLRLPPTESSRGALKRPGFGLSVSALGFRPHRLPSRLTIRSSRPRIVASATCLRYASTCPPPRCGAA